MTGLLRALRKEGYSVDAAMEGREGLQKATEVEYDAIILAVSHREFIALGAQGIRALGKPTAVLFDVKRALPRVSVDDCL